MVSVATSYLDAKTLKQLSQLSPWRTGFAVVFDWAVIAASIAASEYTHRQSHQGVVEVC